MVGYIVNMNKVKLSNFPTMPLVKIKTKYQITLPTNLRVEAGLEVGDLLEAKVEKGRITLTPKTIIDRAITAGLEDIKNGRVYGPFNSTGDLLRSLHKNSKKFSGNLVSKK